MLTVEANVKQEALQKCLFPVGGMMKKDVKEIAKQHGLAVSDKKESMGICFVGKRKHFKNFLSMKPLKSIN